jgi:divalent metal cation (Fe/Co/Zn/Cd) transporter
MAIFVERGLARDALVRRGQWLSTATLLYNAVEAVVAIAAGTLAGSVALIGFGVDSGIELTASLAALWRLNQDADIEKRERAEKFTQRVVGALFLGLAMYVTWDAGIALWRREIPDESTAGMLLAAASLLVMPLLARAKRNVGVRLRSRALQAESNQTTLCAILSAILLVGLGLNALLGWWWADPVAALSMVPIIAKEAFEGLRGEASCADDLTDLSR